MKDMKHLLLPMVLLAGVAVYFVFSFTAMVAPWYIALLSAGSLVSVYLGLAGTQLPQSQQPLAIGISALAMVIEMLYGILYVLNLQAPYLFVAPLPLWADIALAVLHGAPFTLLLFAVSLLMVHKQNSPQHILMEDRITIALEQQSQILKQLTSTDENEMQWIQKSSSIPAMSSPDEIETSRQPDTMQVIEKRYACPRCGATLSKGEFGAARRPGHCNNCKPEK
jgi:hypothetical protein